MSDIDEPEPEPVAAVIFHQQRPAVLMLT